MFKLVLDRKQIEEVMLLGLRVLGFRLVDDKVAWDKKCRPVSASVHVSESSCVAERTMPETNVNNEPVTHAKPVPPPPVVLPPQNLSPEEIEAVLAMVQKRGE